MSKLDLDFLDELFSATIKKKSIFLIVSEYLKESYLPEKSGYEEVWEEISRFYKSMDKAPTLGALSQKLSSKDECLDIIGRMRDLPNIDYEVVLKTFEEFIRRNKFVELYEDVGNTFNKGKTSKDKEKAYVAFKKSAEEFSNFSLKKALNERIFRDFDKRQLERLLHEHSESIPHGIDLLDYYMDGGGQKGETTLFLGDSGVGKSQLLIHCGVNIAKRGYNVAHFQAEGTKKQVQDRYDACWSGTLYRDMKFGNIDSKKLKVLANTIKKLKGEIFLECRERFGSWTINDIRNSLIEMIKNYGRIDVLILDYLELIEPGDGKTYFNSDERHRQQQLGRLLKNLAVEFNIYIITATQASALPPETKEDPNLFLTRWNLSEDKGKLRPFDNFITINQTRDEKQNRVARLYIDKLRENPSDQIIHLCQNLSRSRFYDRKASFEKLYVEDEMLMAKLPWYGQYSR